MSNSIAPGSSADVNVRVTALTTNPNVPVTYKTIILKKNLVNGVNTLTQEMISAINTKYVVKYNYTLGEDITVPANCVLEFDGGSISGNGTGKDTITSDDLRINSNGFCLRGIKFGGKCVLNNFMLAWWIKEYPANVSDTSIDNTTEIQDALNSKVFNLVFPSGKYLHITDTLYYEGCMNMLSDIYNPCSPGTNRDYSRPCIFTDNVVTMLDYRYKSFSDEYLQLQGPLYLGTIKFWCKKDFNDLSDVETPIIHFTSKEIVWGAIFDICVRSTQRTKTIQNVEAAFVSYTGIKLTCDSAAFSGIMLRGTISLTYYGYIFEKLQGFMNDISIMGETWCVYGNKRNTNVYPIRVHNRHQSLQCLFSQQSDKGYFSSPHIDVFAAKVWDLNSNQAYGSVWSVGMPCEITEGDAYKVYNNRLASAYQFPIFGKSGIINGALYDDFSINDKPDNVLCELLSGYTHPGVKNFSLKKNGVDAYSDIYRIHNLFMSKIVDASYTNGQSTTSNAYVLNVTTQDVFVYKFTCHATYINFSKYLYVNGVWDINVKITLSDDTVFANVSFSKSYMANAYNLCFVQLPSSGEFTVEVTCTTGANRTRIGMPWIFLPVMGYKNQTISSINVNKYGIPKFQTGYEGIGCVFFNESTQKVQIRGNDSEWRDMMGNIIS